MRNVFIASGFLLAALVMVQYDTVVSVTRCETPTNYARCTWTFRTATIDEETRVCVDTRCTTVKELAEWLKDRHAR